MKTLANSKFRNLYNPLEIFTYSDYILNYLIIFILKLRLIEQLANIGSEVIRTSELFADFFIGKNIFIILITPQESEFVSVILTK